MSTIKLSKKLKLSQPAISQSAKRVQKIAQGLGYASLTTEINKPMEVPKFPEEIIVITETAGTEFALKRTF